MEPTTALRIYLALLLARLLAAFLPGYIHPDEFFQSPEITAGVVFAYDVFTPWEFSPEQPSRSIVLPYLTTGIPFELLKLAGELAKKYGFFGFDTPYALFVTQRLAFFGLSLLIDDSVIRLHGLTGGRDPLPALLALSSSHVMLIYHTRPFSNAVESVLLTLSFYLLFRASTSYSIKVSARTTGAASAVAGTAAPNGYGEDARSADENAGQSGGFFAPWTIALGWVFALGFFSRITFVLYGFPVGLAFLYLTIRNAAEQDGVLSKLGAFLSDIIPLAFGITSMAAVCVLVDSLYFGHLAVLLADNIVTLSDLIAAFMNDPKSLLELSLAGAPTITPLNNFLYNLDASNLASHGLHPRYLHIAVNLPLLFGPLALLAAYAVVRSALTFRFSAEKLSTTVMAYSALCGVAFLSLMQHQEPRFLLPLLVPLVVTLSGRFASLPRAFWVVWIVFNLVLAVVFGVVHQGGIVPTMGYLQTQSLGIRNCVPLDSSHDACDARLGLDESSNTDPTHHHYTTNLVFYKTYMPPRHLLRYPRTWRDSNVTVNVIDHAGADLDVVRQDLEQRVTVGNHWRHSGQVVFGRRNNSFFLYERTLLIAPATADLLSLIGTSTFNLALVYQRWPHVNFDDLGVLVADMERYAYLNVYLLTAGEAVGPEAVENEEVA